MSKSKFNNSSVTDYAGKVLGSAKNFDQVSVAGFILLAQLFIFMSAEYIWDNEAVKDVFMMYFVMLAVSFSVLGGDNPFYKISLFDGLSQFVFAFVGTVVVLSMVSVGDTSGYMGFENLGKLIIAEALVIGLIEEMTFRGAITSALQKGKMNPYSARLLSAVAFAGFHVFVYEFNITALVTAFIFGLCMQYVWDGGKVPKNSKMSKIGYPLACAGIHAGYNTVIVAGSFSLWAFDVIGVFGGVV